VYGSGQVFSFLTPETHLACIVPASGPLTTVIKHKLIHARIPTVFKTADAADKHANQTKCERLPHINK